MCHDEGVGAIRLHEAVLVFLMQAMQEEGLARPLKMALKGVGLQQRRPLLVAVVRLELPLEARDREDVVLRPLIS